MIYGFCGLGPILVSMGDEAVLEVTETALSTVLEVRAAEDDPAGTALKIGITGSNMTEYQYALELVPVAEAEEGDAVYAQGSHGELTMIIPADSIVNMRGASLDIATGATPGGLVIRNPNTPDPLDGMDLDLTGELPDKVRQVLDQAINPALASHGGYATLVGVEDDTKVVVTMGGGWPGRAPYANRKQPHLDGSYVRVRKTQTTSAHWR